MLAWRDACCRGQAALRRQGRTAHGMQWHGMATAAASSDATSSTSGYTTLEQPVTMNMEVKKSKFITTAWPVSAPSEAMQLIQNTSLSDASHNCWAYVIGNEYRSSDDGEPAGTAGRPILAAIQGEGLDGTCVLVTRYFGGIKLGPGGLVRAYGGAARECLRAAPKVFRRARVTLTLHLPYKLMGAVYGQVDRFGATRMSDEEYTEDGSIRVQVAVDADQEKDFVAAVLDVSAGTVVPVRSAANTSS